MRKYFAAALPVLLGAGLLTPVAHAAESITWSKCTTDPLKAAGADCGFVPVPLDWNNPGGEKIKIAVSRVKHTVPDAQSKGPILVNPGGPGGSGLPWATLGKRVPGGVGGQYDWIGFDPRGVGASEPSLSCDPDYMHYNRPAYVPTGENDAIVQANLKRAKGYAEACAKSPGGKLLNHVKTRDNARDMDAIRAALGAPQISYYGFSYGTYLGQVYATLFGKNLKRVVLDGVVDARDIWYQSQLNQDVAFEKVINIFFEWVAKHNDTYKLGATHTEVQVRYYADEEKLAKDPAGGKIGGSEFADLFLPAGYNQRNWDGIARGWSNWVHKNDTEGLKALYDSANGPGDDNNYAIYLATQCSDLKWPRKWSQWYRDNAKTANQAPFYTWANAWYNAPCLYWPATPGKQVQISPLDAPPTLILSETLDAATPYDGAERARAIFPKSRLVATEGGTTHSNSLRGLACVDSVVATYLSTGVLPAANRKHGKPDVVCQAAPQPTPKPAG
ncbi:pimeloyl-ACP methyl ester carboxylesterase [Crossiella equi]|uniref:Pimeloyl-ACP methyl ester carboxylesterase n=1 Tax=Crossiella equi TaxID=130796 RepID=A0ABS5A8W4_9PSEU|nr:alpha/beta hydrolase [Crossiella equi]MBP2472165.1 pimeloyl-ACP methyl ester carboxylesterase [Crossiella equi]